MKYFIEYNIISRKIEIDIDNINWLEYQYQSFEDIPEKDKKAVLEEYLSDNDDNYFISN